MTRLRSATSTLAVTAAMALATAASPPAQAGARIDMDDHSYVVVAECADGAQVNTTLTGGYSEHPRFDEQGNLTRLALNMQYTMTWTLSSTGASVHPHGTRHVVFDLVAGTITDTGNYRTLTIAGQGRVLKYAGRTVLDLQTGQLLSKSGPDVADIGVPELDNNLVCGLFGVDGA